MASLTLEADCYTDILYLHPYLDNGVPNFLKMRYSDSSCSYLGLCKSRHNNYNAICLFLTFFVKTSLLIFPLIFAQSLLNFHKIVLWERSNGGNNFSLFNCWNTEIACTTTRPVVEYAMVETNFHGFP